MTYLVLNKSQFHDMDDLNSSLFSNKKIKCTSTTFPCRKYYIFPTEKHSWVVFFLRIPPFIGHNVVDLVGYFNKIHLTSTYPHEGGPSYLSEPF